MSDAVIISIVTGAFLLVNSIATLLISNWIKIIGAKVDNYHHEVDGMKTALVEAVKGKGEAEGNLAGRLQQTQELKDAGLASEIKAEKIVISADDTAVKATNVTVTKEKPQ